MLIESFVCGVSPGAIEFDFRTVTGVYSLSLDNQDSKSLLYDLSGRVISSKNIKSEGVYIKDNKKLYIPK